MAVSSNMGTLTLDVVANTGGYTTPLEQAERLTKKAMKEMGMAVDEFGNYTDKSMKKAAEATKQLDASFERMSQDMQRQIALYGDVSRAATLRYDLERGSLKNLSAEQKRTLSEMATRLDAMDDASAAFRRQEMAVNQTNSAYRGLRGVATGLGYQIQDITVQLQQGTNVAMVFAQQGSQIASLIPGWGALAGAAIAIGGALAGSLIPGLTATKESAEDASARIKELASDLLDLNTQQREIVQRGLDIEIEKQNKALEDQKKVVKEQLDLIARLNAEQGKSVSRAVAPGLGITEVAATPETVDNTKRLKEANDALNAAETAVLETERAIADLRDPLKLNDLLDKKREEAKLSGLTGEALYAEQAALAGLVDERAKEYVQLMLIIEANNKRTKESDKAEKSADKQAEAEAKLVASLQRQIDLYGVTSKAAQMEYDIRKGIVEVSGGVESANAKLLIQGSARLDQMQAETKAQEEYKKSLEDWVKAQNTLVADRNKILDALRDQEAQLYMNADAYLEMELRAKGASEWEVAEAKQRSYRIEQRKSEMAAIKKAEEEAARSTQEMWNRIDGAAADVWSNMLDGAESSLDSLVDIFKKTLAEMAHEAVTKPILMQFQQAFMSGGLGSGDTVAGYTSQAYQNWAAGKGGASAGSGGSAATGAIGMAGIYAAGAAVAIAAVNSWNEKQDEKFEKMTAAYRQGVQSTGTLLGLANAKSDSIAGAMESLGDLSGDTLNVNRDMYMALLSIDAGINGVAAGFARQFGLGGSADFSYIRTGSAAGLTRLGDTRVFKEIERWGSKIDFIGGEFITGFAAGIMDGINKAVYSKSKRIVDTGIQFIGTSLGDILADGTLEAFAYADVRTKKRVLGVTTSNKLKTETQDLDDALLNQFADVFAGAGAALELSAEAFGLDFDKYIDRMLVDPQKLSLKDLEGDALTKEIEAFFSATLDQWASVLTEGSDVLTEFQQVGEGAFETVVRLASELNTFNRYVDLLGLDFSAVGFDAVKASQDIAEFAGGFDQLTSSLNTYYQEFFDETERNAKQMELLSAEFKELGYDAVPASREAFRDLIEGLDLTVAKDQELFAELINLSGVFAELVPATEALTEAGRSAADIAREAYDLETRLLQLQGDTQALRDREVAALDESNQGRLREIFALEDSIAVSEERKGLENQLLQLQGDTNALREQELNALDESNHALQEQIYALQDAARVAAERSNLESQLMQMLGMTGELRARELSALSESNRGLKERIYALEDERSAIEALKTAASEAMGALSSALARERERINGIVSEVDSAREVLMGAIEREKEAITQGYQDRVKAIEAQSSAEQKAFAESQKLREKALSSGLSLVNDNIKALESILGMLTDSVQKMAIETDYVLRAQRASAQDQIDAVIASVRAGGALPDPSSLKGALTVLENNPDFLYATFEDMAYATAVAQNKVAELAGLTQSRLVMEEQKKSDLEMQLQAAEATVWLADQYEGQLSEERARYESEIKALDTMAEQARKQSDLITGVDTGIVSLADAQKAFEEAVLSADFTNAKEQLEALDVLEKSAQEQINVLLGTQQAVLSVEDAVAGVNTAVQLAAEKISSASVDSAESLAAITSAALVAEIKALKDSLSAVNDAIYQETRDGTDILREMLQEQIAQ